MPETCLLVLMRRLDPAGLGYKRRTESAVDTAAPVNQHHAALSAQQQGKRMRPTDMYPKGAAGGYVGPDDAECWSRGLQPGSWSSRAAAVTDEQEEYIIRKAPPTSHRDIVPAAATAAAAAMTQAQAVTAQGPAAASAATAVNAVSLQRSAAHQASMSHTSQAGTQQLTAQQFSTVGNGELTTAVLMQPGGGVVPPPRPVRLDSAGLHPSGSDAVNNGTLCAAVTPITTAGAAAVGHLTPSVGSGSALLRDNMPLTLEESWRVITSSQPQVRQLQQLQALTAAGAGRASAQAQTLTTQVSSRVEAAASVAEGVGGRQALAANACNSTNHPTAVNYFTDMLKEAMTPEEQQAAAYRASMSPQPPAVSAAAAAAPAADTAASRKLALQPGSSDSAAAAPAAVSLHLLSPSPQVAVPAAADQVFSPFTAVSLGFTLDQHKPPAAAHTSTACGRLMPPSLAATSAAAAAAIKPMAVTRDGTAMSGSDGNQHVASSAVSFKSQQVTTSQQHGHMSHPVPQAAGGPAAARHVVGTTPQAQILPAGWASSIDTAAGAAKHAVPGLHASLSVPGGVASSSPGTTRVPSPVLLRRHNSAPVTTGVLLLSRQSGTPRAAAVITPGPTAPAAAQPL